MRTTVSDILLFDKCPYAWYCKVVNKREPLVKSKALEHGTSIHKQIQQWLEAYQKNNNYFDTTPIPDFLADKHLAYAHAQGLVDTISKYKVEAVEKPIVIEVGGHTLDGRPDSVLVNKETGQRVLGQVKTSTANKAHHIDLVRFSIHECMYAIGVGSMAEPILNTLLFRFITTSSGKKAIFADMVTRTTGDIEAARQYVVKKCDEMEELIHGNRAEGWQSPPSCIDWITGQKCGYFEHCHRGVALTNETLFKPTEDRYADSPIQDSGS